MRRTAIALELRRLVAPRRIDGIVAQVKDLVLRGRLRPGERLPSERELARAWSVGRPTVREAIQQLEGLGFVEVRAARGSFVRSLTPRGIDDVLTRAADEDIDIVGQVLDVRIALEGWIAAEAARCARPDQARRITKIVDDLSAAAERGDSLSALDAAFHRAVVEAAGNTVMLHMVESVASLQDTVRAFKKQIGFRQTTPRVFVACHRDVARAITARDPERARRAMVAHLEMVKRMLVATSTDAAGTASAPTPRRRSPRHAEPAARGEARRSRGRGPSAVRPGRARPDSR